MKKTLPSIRVQDRILELMGFAIRKHNENSLSKLDIATFRRISYELLAKGILQDNTLVLSILNKELPSTNYEGKTNAKAIN